MSAGSQWVHDRGRTCGAARLYLGAAPGAGKTYAMLSEGHRRAERGTDVVAAAVDTHGREPVEALLAGLERVPSSEACWTSTPFSPGHRRSPSWTA